MENIDKIHAMLDFSREMLNGNYLEITRLLHKAHAEEVREVDEALYHNDKQQAVKEIADCIYVGFLLHALADERSIPFGMFVSIIDELDLVLQKHNSSILIEDPSLEMLVRDIIKKNHFKLSRQADEAKEGQRILLKDEGILADIFSTPYGYALSVSQNTTGKSGKQFLRGKPI